ncbi:MAG: CSLREA domain-containing protein [Chloroflexi bacterium]|nr:CSLREA domain-containing protein [Chloroflexota bacterium]
MPRTRFPMSASSRLLVALILGFILSFMALAVQPVHAASITVDTTADIVAVDGLCSLREAIANSNNDAATNADCAAGSGADTISFTGNGTITLTGGGSLVIADPLTINGNGSANTIIEANANANVAAFRVFTVSTGTLTLDAVQVRNGGNDSTAASNGGCISVFTNAGLTLQNGVLLTGCRTTAPADGAAISASTGTTVTITGSTVQNNISGGNGGVMQANGVVNITNSTISNNNTAATSAGNGFGGAIACLAGCTLTVTGSTFTSNSAVNTGGTAQGGAIYIGSSAADHSIADTTFTNNSVSGVGSGMGGAIHKASTTALTISGSVFTGNSATTLGGAIYNNQGTVTVTSSRIESNTAANGGAYYTVNGTTGATDSLTGSCIVGNSATAVVDLEVSSDMTATGNWWGTNWGPQIVAAGGGTAISGGDSISGDGAATSGDSIADVDVGLTNAGAADGSSVPTGNWLTSAPTVAGAPCASASWTPPVPTSPDVTISPAAFNVNEGSNADYTITRTGATTSALTVTLNITQGTNTVGADYTLTPASGTISAQSGNNVTVTIPAGSATLTVNLAAVDDVDAEADNTLTLTLVDQAAYNLGATTSSTATIPANDTVVTNLNDSGEGSLRQAVTNANAFPSSDTITFTTDGTINFASNLPDLANNGTLTINGGGVITLVPVSNTGYRVFTLASGAQVTLNALTMSVLMNTYISNGGLIYIDSGALTVTNSSFTSGNANNGGAIYNNSGTVLVTGTQFFNNTATSGGGIYNQSGQVTVTATTFDSNLNVAALNGGAIYNASGTVTVTNSTIRNLGSSSQGAGTYNAGTLFVYDTTFANNHPNSTTVAADLYNSGTATVYNSILADQVRGVNCTNSGSLTIQNTLIEDGSCGITNGVNGNLTGDPSLGTFTGVYYLLNGDSLAINAGDNSLIPGGVTTDQAGNARIQQGIVDLGAYESPYTPVVPEVTISASDNTGTEAGGDPITFRIERSFTNAAALTVNYTIGGAATNGTDYTPTLSGAAVIAANTLFIDITVTPTDDALDELDETITLTLIDDAAYDLGAMSSADGTISDDDTAGITVNPTSGLSTGEAGSADTFTVVLNTQPTADVTIDLTSSDTTEGTVSPTQLTFTTANWNAAQTVTVTGVDDAVVDGDIGYTITTAAAVSSDANYNGMDAADVSVTNTDDDTAGITVTPTSGLITGEAGSADTFTVVLDSEPTADVTIDLTSSDTSEGTVAPTQLTFTNANWNAAQTVTVTGVDDALVDGNIAYTITTAAAVSADAHYSGMDAADVSVTNTDDDTAGITVTPTSGLVTTEAGTTADFTVVLNTQPTADVTIDLTSSDTTEGTVSPAQVTFTNANWNSAQTVTVTGVDDAVADGDIGYTITTAAVVSADTNYSGMDAVDVSVTNTDDDTAGITVAPTGGLITTEAGTTADFTVVLNTQPTADVTIDLTSSATSEGTVAPTQVTFTTANWNSAKTVTVTGVDDAVVDGDIAYTITTAAAVSADANYSGMDAADVSVTNNDNDVVGITVSPSGTLLTTEAGGTATFTFVLNSQPTADVTISLTASDPTEATAAPSPLVLTTANWNAPQTVTVTGVDDPNADGNQDSQVTFVVSSADAAYNGLVIPAVVVTNVDDDTAGITVSPAAFTASAGFSGSYQIGLLTPPSDGNPITVLVTFEAAELTVNGGSVSFLLTFSDTTPQTIPFTVLTNTANTTARTTSISHLVSASTAPEYPVGLARTVAVTIGATAVALPMPPPSPTCESENFDPDAVIRTGVPNTLIYAINCRVLYYNSHPTDWLGQALYSEANLGLPGLLELGVQQAVDIFSPPPSSLTYFDGGAVFCLRGSGTLIWLAASQSPRHAEIIGSYSVGEFPGFTCTTLFEPGTLILVSANPLD